MKTWILIIGLIALLAFIIFNKTALKGILSKKDAVFSNTKAQDHKGSLYDFTLNDLQGNPIALSEYKGKPVVLINVASKCGFTPQYADWQKFHEKYGDKVAVLGFPANNFMSQEPGTDAEIGEFCQKNYGVTFKMFSKIDVVGDNKAPLYKWLSEKELNGWNDKEPTWNFCKYVVDKEGNVTHFFASKITPDNPEFLQAVGI